jgi:hypothetical protein
MKKQRLAPPKRCAVFTGVGIAYSKTRRPSIYPVLTARERGELKPAMRSNNQRELRSQTSPVKYRNVY